MYAAVEVDLTIPSAKVQRVSVKGQEYYHLQVSVCVLLSSGHTIAY